MLANDVRPCSGSGLDLSYNRLLYARGPARSADLPLASPRLDLVGQARGASKKHRTREGVSYEHVYAYRGARLG